MGKTKLFLILIITIFSFNLISADATSLDTSSVNPNESHQYKITINNNEIWPNGNITMVNLTVPIGLVYVDESNSTTSSYETFRNESNILAWENTSVDGYLINGTNSKEFWFSASAIEFGDYNITILVANETESLEYNLTVTIEDSRDPEVKFKNPTPNSNSNIAQTFIPVNITATDEIAIDTITIFIYNSTRLLASGSNDTSPFFLNFTGLVDGTYTINATVNDTSGNSDKTTRTITLNTSAPTGCSTNWGNCTSWSTCTNQNQTRTCSDLNLCNTTTNNKQNQTQTCGEAAPATCTPNWDCGNWEPSKCKEGETQEKLCTDLNDCSGDNPERTIRNCVVSGGPLSTVWIASIGGAILFILIVVIFFYIKGKMSLGSELSKFAPRGLPISMPRINFPRRNIRIPRLPRRPPMHTSGRVLRKPIRRGPQRRNPSK